MFKISNPILPLFLLMFMSCSPHKRNTNSANHQLKIDNHSKSSPINSFSPGKKMIDNNGIPINAHGGGIMYYNGKYYWYGQHMVEGKTGNRAQVGVHVYSSDDLYNWIDQGIALKVIDDDPEHDITKDCILERPKVIYNEKTNKFVMWFHLELRDNGYKSARSGVAISDTPEGPFTYLRSFRPNAGFWPVNVKPIHKEPVSEDVKDAYCGGEGCLPSHPDTVNLLGRDFLGGQMARDMTLFVDADGKAYHIYSSEENSTLHISQLSDDYTSYSGVYARFFVGRYMEAPSIFRTSKGKYFFIGSGCTGWAPNAARAAVADHIFGPWRELENPCIGEGAELTFESQSTYILPVQGQKDQFLFMADRWKPENPIDGRYIWLPIKIGENSISIEWKDEWTLEDFSD